MKEIVIVSGKGGTGKTTVLAMYARLADQAVIADCDVDAPNLHMLLKPKVLSSESFVGSRVAVLDAAKCTQCGECVQKCRFDALRGLEEVERQLITVDSQSCEGCAVCVEVCSESAIEMRDREVGEWFLSETDCGTMAHALLEPGAENSGKLVAMVKHVARRAAGEEGAKLILVDGPPGIGCPVISALAGADIVVIVSEPTVSGLSDFKRIADLSSSFDMECALIVNKSDLNEEVNAQLLIEAESRGMALIGSVPYDEGLMAAMAGGSWEDGSLESLAMAEISRSYDRLLRLL